MPGLVHPSAIIDPTAVLGEDVSVGPFAVVGPDVQVGARTVIKPHAVLEARTIVGEDCEIGVGAVLGGPPQDLNYQSEPTRARIGNRVLIREYVTVNRATGEGKETVVGNGCMLMAYSHLAHNCQLGNHVILANCVQLGGHVQVDDYAFFGGMAVAHQNCRVGRMAMIGGVSGIRQDAAPFAKYDGRTASFVGINSIGLRRRGITNESRNNLKRAFHYLCFSKMNQSQAIEAIQANIPQDEQILHLLDFLNTSQRGVILTDRSRKNTNHSEENTMSALNMTPV